MYVHFENAMETTGESSKVKPGYPKPGQESNPEQSKQQKRAQTNEKPYSCSQCDRSFKYASDMSKHEKTHTGEKPHQCKQCGKAFLSHSNFKRHARVHTGERPYNCSKCNEAFKTLGALKAHDQRLHNEERNFNCAKNRNYCLRANRKTAHN